MKRKRPEWLRWVNYDALAKSLAHSIASLYRGSVGVRYSTKELDCRVMDARLAAVTRRRLKLNRWKRAHPNHTLRQLKAACIRFDIPLSEEAVSAKIKTLCYRVQAEWLAEKGVRGPITVEEKNVTE